jgi:hypothetical protein
MVLRGQRTQERSILKVEQLVVSNLVQELLPFSKSETTSFEPTVDQELVAVSNLVQELLVVSKIETTSFEPNSGTITSFENWKRQYFQTGTTSSFESSSGTTSGIENCVAVALRRHLEGHPLTGESMQSRRWHLTWAVENVVHIRKIALQMIA